MSTLLKAFNSTVGRKLVLGLSGLGLILFAVAHLLENLLLYAGAAQYNGYVEFLHSFGRLLYVAEIGLLSLFLIHAFLAIQITIGNRAARGPQRYAVVRSKGDPSRSNLASRNMIITGLVILAFLIFHLWQFRFGPGLEAGYVTQIDHKNVRDLYRLVFEVFHDPLYVSLYVAAMIFLGFHIRHGFWSAFQSLGAMAPRLSKPVYCLGFLLGLILALGFLGIPLWFYFGGQS